MSDKYTYETRDYHCPTGCGHEATNRSVDRVPWQKCPRCNGATFGEFLPTFPAKHPTPLIPDRPIE